MDDVKKSIIIIALNNLIESYNLALEDTQDLNNEQIEYMKWTITLCGEIIKEIGQELPIETVTPRPKWEKNQ